jgi:hypothetical protein
MIYIYLTAVGFDYFREILEEPSSFALLVFNIFFCGWEIGYIA